MERNGKMKKYVLDTSVIIKWFSEYDEDDLEKAINLRYEILEGMCSVVVPDLLFYEIANALRYNPHLKSNDVKDALKAVIEMGFDVKGIETDIMDRAIEMAFKYNVTVYDASFLALSQTEKRLLVTADYKFVERLKGFKHIIKLSEL